MLVVVEQLPQRCCELRVQLVYLLLCGGVTLLHCRTLDTSQEWQLLQAYMSSPTSKRADIFTQAQG